MCILPIETGKITNRCSSPNMDGIVKEVRKCYLHCSWVGNANIVCTANTVMSSPWQLLHHSQLSVSMSAREVNMLA